MHLGRRSQNGSTKSRIRKPKLEGRLFSGENLRSHNRFTCQSRATWPCPLPARGACCCCRCCCPPSPPPPPTSALPQLHVLLNVLHMCMMLELGNQCAVLVAAVPALLLRCLLSPATTSAHAPACAHQPHAVAGQVHTHTMPFPQPRGQPHMQELLNVVQCVRAQEVLLA